MEPALKIFEAFIIAFSVVLCIGWGVLALCWAFPQLLGDIPDQYAGVPSGRDGTSAAQKVTCDDGHRTVPERALQSTTLG